MIWKVWALATAITMAQMADDYTVIVLGQPPAAAEPEWRLVMFTADWCKPCQQWKRDHMPKIEEEMPVELVDITKTPETRRARVIEGQRVEAISRIPTFWLVKKGEKKPSKVWVGGQTLAQVQAILGKLDE